MTESLTSWWRMRTPRERGLLLFMFALVALVLAWLLVVRPLSDALDTAKRRHADAVAALGEAQARAGAADTQANPVAAPLPLDSWLNQSAGEAGFGGARVAGRGPARAIISIPAARPQALFAWVRGQENRGLVVESLRAHTNRDRTVAVEAVFRARAG